MFLIKSTSLHNLNADKKLGWLNKKLWFRINSLNNNLFPDKFLFQLVQEQFIADVSGKNWNLLGIRESPPRKLSNLFWLQLPWNRIKEELREINVFDTGCGDGKYAELLSLYSGNVLNSYTGVDCKYHESWGEFMSKNQNISFFSSKSDEIFESIPENTNFFMSQSAIEHFEKDLLYFEHIREFITKREHPIIQVHLFPSCSCLKLYRYHGVRQYTPRTVSIITKIFHNFSDAILYKLGGKNCNYVHYYYITQPILIHNNGDKRTEDIEAYNCSLRDAIKADNDFTSTYPSFYALIIHSYPRNKIFR